MHTITFGTDPEIVAIGGSPAAVIGANPNDRIAIPGYHALGLTNPDAVIDLSFGDVGPDGAAVEWRQHPRSDIDTLVREIGANIREISAYTASVGIQSLSVIPNFALDPRWVDLLDPSYGNHSSVAILGCDPDFNVYGLDYPARPHPTQYFYRTLGGHIHVGLPAEFTADPVLVAYFVAGMDKLIGSAGTYWCNSQEARDRKVLYGKAGMVRVKETLGLVEYRPLPSQALVQTEEVCNLVFEAARAWAEFVIDVCATGISQQDMVERLSTIVGGYDDLIAGVVPSINDHNVDSCRTIQSEFADRTNPKISDIVSKMQRVVLPDNFDVKGW